MGAVADDALASPFSSLGSFANKEKGENWAACWEELWPTDTCLLEAAA